MYPKISIVTPTFNQGQYIEETILSVLNQQYPNLEYIIIDGGSTDNTLDIIKKYESKLTYWLSEKDNGQVDAINKGLKRCSGEIFNWLNSDDYLEPNALYEIAEKFKEGADLVAGGARIFQENKTIETVFHKNLSAKSLMYWNNVQFVQPGVWMKRLHFIKSGGIDETLHFAFDWDLYIRYLSKFPQVNYSQKLLVHFRYHKNSKTVSLQERFQNEETQIIKKLSHIETDASLKRIAKQRLTWFSTINKIKQINSSSKTTKLSKFISILTLFNSDTLFMWRAIMGSVRELFQH